MAKVYKQALANLQEGFKIIGSGKNWIRGNYNRNDEKFCAVGVTNFVDGPGKSRALNFLRQAVDELFPQFVSVEELNDAGKRKVAHKRVVAIFQRAIQLAKGAPAKA